ncbi:MAG: hypothetical protein K2X81_17025, partial [Candidatus Obscuribacterales bacterium]|nr:hypothetical protein [Candidatus Obscuribacterales bacterium]
RARPADDGSEDITEDEEESEHHKAGHAKDDPDAENQPRTVAKPPFFGFVQPEAKFSAPLAEPETGLPRVKLFFGYLHGHSVFSDGQCMPSELYGKAKADGTQDFATISEHSHLTARAGVGSHGPSDPRAEEQAKVPIVAEAPQLYNSTIHEAENVTETGKFVGLYGVELGTIGKAGQDAISGVNHINVFMMKEFIESFKDGKTPKRSLNTGHIPEEQEFTKPEVFKVPDGDHKKLVEFLNQHSDATGGRPVIQLNHPRWSQDESESLEEDVRGRDYGQKSFENQEEWVKEFGKYASLLEIISGEALSQEQSGAFPSSHVHAKDFAGYIDKGLHVAPTFGRDSHFCDLAGTPAATGVLGEGLDPKSLMDGMRERRTMATTNKDSLAGVMVMNDKFVMGSIVDEKEAGDNVHISVTVLGNKNPEAQYIAKLWSEPNIGSGELPTKPIQTVHISGDDLNTAGNKIQFEDVEHESGKKSAYWVEVQKKSDDEPNQPARMWTAPVWVESK